MGVRCFWPHNMIGHGGLVVNQALKLRSLPTNHQVSPRIRDGLRFSAEALWSCGGQIVLLTGEHGPGNPCRLIGERDNRAIEPSPRREPLQPLRAAVVMLRQSKHDGTSAMNYLTPEVVIGAPANPAEPRLATGRILTRHEADPRRKFPAQIENDARRRPLRRAPSRLPDRLRQFRQPSAGFVCPAKAQEPLIQLVEPEVDSWKLVEQVDEETPREIGKVGDHDSVLRLL